MVVHFDICYQFCNRNCCSGGVCTRSSKMGIFFLISFSLDPKMLPFVTVLALVLFIPIGVLGAVSNNYISLSVLSQMIGGFVVPGNALAMNMFRGFGSVTMGEILFMAYNLKIGHYMKIPPRAMFRATLLPTFISTVIVM